MRNFLSAFKSFVLIVVLVLVAVIFAAAQVTTIHPDKVIPITRVGTNIALRDAPEQPVSTGPMKEHENESLENRWLQGMKENPDALPQGADPVLQRNYSQRTKGGGDHTETWTNILSNWTGLAANAFPSDNTISVGPDHVIQLVNNIPSTGMRIWNKAGTVLVSNKLISSITAITDYGDPNIIYDQQADRFVFVVLYSFSDNKLVVGVSQTPDPTGAWYTYVFNTSNGFPDYPKIAVWDSSYFITTNSTTPTVYALKRSAMLTGSSAGTAQVFTMSRFGTIGFQSASPITQTGAVPPTPGTPATIIRVADDAWSGISYDQLQIFRVHINWTTPSNSTMTQSPNLHIASYNSNLCGLGARQCIPMLGSATILDPMNDIMMDKGQYRNFGTHESFVCSHVCNADGAGTAGVRWYELRRDTTTGNWFIYQQSTYSLDQTHRFMSSITMNDSGTVALGYNVSSSMIDPGIRITGRNNCDNINAMTIPETVVQSGTIANNGYRYGDYNAMLTDPADGSFWFTANWNPTANWATNVVHFTFKSCSPAPAASITSTSTSACDSLCVTFTDASFRDTARVWLFPGGTPSASTSSSPVVCYSTGTYSVSLIAMNSYGTDTVVNPNYVTVYHANKPTIIIAGTTLISSAATTYQWYDSTGAISGSLATKKNYGVKHSGYFHVCTVDSKGCRACSDSVYVLYPNGVNDITADDVDFQLYPNPVKGGSVLNIALSKNILKGELNIFNVVTEKVYSEIFNGRQKAVSVKLSPGVYLLRVKDEDRQYFRKFVVQ